MKILDSLYYDTFMPDDEDPGHQIRMTGVKFPLKGCTKGDFLALASCVRVSTPEERDQINKIAPHAFVEVGSREKSC